MLSYSGSILAPSVYVDHRSDGEASGTHTQVIGYNVSTNGNVEVYVNYQEDEDHKNLGFQRFRY